jgi:transmembrane 9 superfamily member 3
MDTCMKIVERWLRPLSFVSHYPPLLLASPPDHSTGEHSPLLLRSSFSLRKHFTSSRADLNSEWQKAMVATCLLLPVVVVSMISILNSIAIYYDTINAIPAMVIVKMVAVWLFVSFPLAIIGTIFGRHFVTRGDLPCRVNSIPRSPHLTLTHPHSSPLHIFRPIPAAPWYASPLFIIPVSGILPFGSIFIEMYFIFTSFWSYKFYYVYGFMLLVYLILSMVTICTTIVSVYFILNSENYHWQWLSFFSAGSTSVYVFLYSIYYFMYKTQMTGLLQVSYYFGYMYITHFSLPSLFTCLSSLPVCFE